MCVKEEEGAWKLHGMLSYHSSCGRGPKPSIFSNIMTVKKWIEQTTGTDYAHIERQSTSSVQR